MTDDMSPERRRAFIGFRDALADFSDDPGPDNLERYLAASRALDEARKPRPAVRPASSRGAQPPLAA